VKRVAIQSQKGGSGKTTTTVSLAVEAQKCGLTAVVVDLDPQANATTWSDRRHAHTETPVVVSAQAARLVQVLKAAEQNGAEIAFIDTPPRASEVALAAVKAADLVLIPCRPAIFDLDTMETTRDLIKTAGKQVPIFAVLNGVPAIGFKKREQAEEVIRSYGIEVCPAAFAQRAAFSDSVTLGLTPQEYDPEGNAAQEIGQVYKFVCELLNIETRKGVKDNGTESRRFALSHAK
jgi:chromosome partitioning protein